MEQQTIKLLGAAAQNRLVGHDSPFPEKAVEDVHPLCCNPVITVPGVCCKTTRDLLGPARTGLYCYPDNSAHVSPFQKDMLCMFGLWTGGWWLAVMNHGVGSD